MEELNNGYNIVGLSQVINEALVFSVFQYICHAPCTIIPSKCYFFTSHENAFIMHHNTRYNVMSLLVSKAKFTLL